MIKTIPLNKLVASPTNVRRSRDAQSDLQLKSDIDARGLLQNLVVTPVSKPRGSFAVEAGGRRLRALKQLADEGRIDGGQEICCLVLERGSAAQEASLAENFQRLSMNPADECVAFRELIEQGADVEGIARRFGLTLRFVEGRLRLAALAPVVFEALGAGEISLDVAKAYAATPDIERQAHVFEQMSRGYGAAHPDSIRRMMTQATVAASDRRALLVGEDAYLAAGGRIERDLFDEQSGARWLDVALVERLANDKLEAAAKAAADELRFASVRPCLESWIGSSQTEGLKRIVLETPPLTDAESARVDTLEAEIDELAELIDGEDCDDQARSDAETKARELSRSVDAIVNKPPVISEELKPHVVAFLMLDDEGQPRLHPTLYQCDEARSELATGIVSQTPDGELGDAKADRASRLSQRLVDELAIQRRDILAAHVAADTSLALDLLIFLMIDREAGYSGEKSGSSLSARRPSDPVAGFKTPDAAAAIARAESAEALDRSWAEGSCRAERFDRFRTLPDDARAAWLGEALANTLEASLQLAGERACAFHDHLGQVLGIDVARWWRPTGANFFDRVSKAVTLAALEQVGGSELAGRYSNAKKAELAQACERIFAGDFIGDTDAKEAALAWVPDVMRFAPPELATLETGSGAGQDLTDAGQITDEPESTAQQTEEAA